MDKYIKTALRATGEAWTVFKTSASTGQNPKLAFQQLRDKYKGTDIESYVTEYTEICEEELPNITDKEKYLEEAKTIGNELWLIFKELVPRVYKKTMTDTDWNIIVQKTSSFGMSSKWKYANHYAERYSSALAWELDRKSRRLRGIMTDDLTDYLEKHKRGA